MIFAGLPLQEAAQSGHISIVKLLLDRNAEINKDILFKVRHFQIIKYLLKRGAELKSTDSKGNTLLLKECERGNLEKVKYLTKHSNPDVSGKNKREQTTLHLACGTNSLKTVKFLIQHCDANVSTKNSKGQTPLHLACAEWNNLEIVKFLIEEANADPAVTCNKGKTALHYAARNVGGASIVRYLIENQKLDIEASDNNRKIALQYSLKIFKAFKEFRHFVFFSAAKAKILKARENKNSDYIFEWIKKSYVIGINNVKKEDKVIVSCFTAGLTYFKAWLNKKDATHNECNPLLLIVSYCNRVDIAEYMFNQDLCYIKKRFNSEEANLKRNLLLKSYLKFSCQCGFLELTKFLFQEMNKRKESFHHLSFDGQLLKTACYNKHMDVFKFLLEEEEAKDEADVFMKDLPLHYACKYGSQEMVQYLIEMKPFDFKAEDKVISCGTIKIMQYLIEEQKACIDTSYAHGGNVFQMVSSNSEQLEVVKYIFQKTNQDVNVQDENGSTALHLACKRENLKAVQFLINDMNADLCLVDKEGRTPLHVYCQYSCQEFLLIPKLLVSKEENILAKDKSGKIPLQVAKGKSQPYFATLLVAFLNAVTKR